MIMSEAARPVETPLDPAYMAERDIQLRVTSAQLATHISYESVTEFIDGADTIYQYILEGTKPQN
jgi:hypothetical protein